MVFLMVKRNIRAAKIIVGISRPSVAGYNTDAQRIPVDAIHIDLIELCNSLLKQISVIHNMNFGSIISGCGLLCVYAYVLCHRCCFQEGAPTVEILRPCYKCIMRSVRISRIVRHSFVQTIAIFNNLEIV